jgi:hypothetical protein
MELFYGGVFMQELDHGQIDSLLIGTGLACEVHASSVE